MMPLTEEALGILAQRRRRHPSEEWIFPSSGRTGHITDIKRAWHGLLDRAKITGLRIHDLRRTLGSWQAGSAPLPIIGKTLGHQSSDATEIYARLHLDPVRRAINAATGAMLTAGKVSRGRLLKAAERA